MTNPQTPESPVLSSVSDGVAHLELNRPDTYNALDLTMARALGAAVQEAAADDRVRVVLLSGRGRAFCAGGDVKQMAAATDREAMLLELAGAVHHAVLALANLSKPVVAAVHGPVAGGGLGLSCTADLVLAGESTRFLSAFVGIGVTPDSSTSWLLPQIVGLRRALELTLTNRVLSADEALHWGLATAVHPDSEVVEAGRALAMRLAAGPAHALGQTRRLVRDSSARTLADQLDEEARSIAARGASAEAAALIEEFARR